MKKILCIGNWFHYPDNFGLMVYQELKNRKPEGIRVIEGALGGLNLAPHFEDDHPTLIVDHGVGFEREFLALSQIYLDFVQTYSHDLAFYYLLKTLPKKPVWLFLSNDPNWKEVEIPSYCDKILELAQRL